MSNACRATSKTQVSIPGSHIIFAVGLLYSVEFSVFGVVLNRIAT